MHPFVIVELALGGLHDRDLTLASLELLPQLPVAELHEVSHLIEVRKLYKLGVGFVDAHLIASLMIVETSTGLWTNDEALKQAADSIGCLATPPFHG